MSDNKRKTVTGSTRLLIPATVGVFVGIIVATALMSRTRASAQIVGDRIAAALTQGTQHRREKDAARDSKLGVHGGVEGGIEGGVAGGVPDGISGGVPGGIAGGVPGGVRGGVPGGMAGGTPGSVPGEVPGGVEGGVTGGIGSGPTGLGEGNQSESAALAQATAEGQKGTYSFRMTSATEEFPISAQNVKGAPVSIAGASIQTIRFDQISPAPATPEDGIRYRIKLTVHVLNTTDRVVTGVALRLTGLTLIGQSRVVNCFDSISGQSIFTFHNLVGEGLISFEEASGVRMKIVGVRFGDGSAWGSNPPGPYPPAVSKVPSAEGPTGPDAVPPGAGPEPSTQPQGAPPGTAAPPPSQSPADLPNVIRKSGGVLQSTAINRVLPTYPEPAKAAGISGAVVVEVLIDEQGNVQKATAIAGPEPLRDAAVEAARQWRWNPTTLSGVPMRVTGVQTFNFAM